MNETDTTTVANIHVAVVREGIQKANNGDIEAAVSTKVLKALASLKSIPEALGEFLMLLEELTKSHKSIRKGDIERAVNKLLTEKEKDTTGKLNTADEIVSLVIETCTLFTDQDDEAHADVNQNGHREIWPINSGTFKDLVSLLVYRSTGKTTRAAVLADAFSTLNGIAKHDCEKHNVYLRVASDGNGGYYIDVGDKQWLVMHITKNGWQIISDPPVKFRRSKATKALPEPKTGGTLADLKALVNVSDSDDLLLVTALIDWIRPDTAYPVVELIGEQGSGKSTTAENIRRMIDPKSVNLRSAAKSVEDLYVGSRSNHIVCLNNLSFLSSAQQDALCNLSTGGGYASRKLYSNDEEVSFDAKRPTLLNGINAVATQPDLVSRVVRLECPTLDAAGSRLDDKELAEIFNKHAPLAMGFLLDTMVKALAVLPDIELVEKPRLLDFALLGAAVGRVLHGSDGEQAFTIRYREAREAASLQALESMPVILALLEYLEIQAPYTGNFAMLLKNIEKVIGKTADAAWPKSAKGLSTAVGRAKPVLNLLGWSVVPASRDKHGARVTIKQSSLERNRNYPNSTYTNDTKCTKTSVGVGGVGGAGNSTKDYEQVKDKKKHEGDQQTHALACLQTRIDADGGFL